APPGQAPDRPPAQQPPGRLQDLLLGVLATPPATPTRLHLDAAHHRHNLTKPPADTVSQSPAKLDLARLASEGDRCRMPPIPAAETPQLFALDEPAADQAARPWPGPERPRRHGRRPPRAVPGL